MEKITKRDVLTPANAITAFGLVLVLIGCFFLDSLAGLALVVLGRSMDLLDGPVARATNTTRFSVVFDPFADKIAFAAILISSLYFDLVPLFVIAFILLQNIATVITAYKSYSSSHEIGATIPGKLNMFFQTMAVLFFIASSVTPTGLSETLTVLAYANFIACIPLGLLSLKTYKKRSKPE